jgi:exonuclease VII small subunit
MSNDLGETSSGTKKLSEQIDELTAIVKKLEDPTIELEDAEQRIETVSAAHSDS